VEILKNAPVEVGYLPWQIRPPAESLTVVCKLSFDLEPGGVCTLAQEGDGLEGDLRTEDDEELGLRYANDLAVLKPAGEFTLSGTCYPPRPPATASAVSVRVGSVRKDLAVFGDRQWSRLGLEASEPQPFSEMSLAWHRSLGGRKSTTNPHGCGTRSAVPELRSSLPNFENPTSLIRSPRDRPTPANYLPIDSTAPIRRELAGTYDENWKKTRWPYLPPDFDPHYFQHAPPDQRTSGYWKGDEEISLRHLSADRTLLETRLPGLRPRVFLLTPGGVPSAENECPLSLDTIHIDADRNVVLCVWRGIVETPAPALELFSHAFATIDPVEAASSIEAMAEAHSELGSAGEEEELEFEAERAPDIDEEEKQEAVAPPELEPPADLPLDDDGTPLRDPSSLRALYLSAGVPIPASVLGYVEALEAAGANAPVIEPDQPPEAGVRRPLRPEAREQLLLALDAGTPLDDLDLTCGDFSGLDLTKVDFSGCELSDSDLSDCDLSGATLHRSTLIRCRLHRANLRGADLTAAELSHTEFDDACLADADLSEAVGQELRLHRANLRGAVLAKCELLECKGTGADLDGAQLDQSDFASSNFDDATFRRASLIEANFEGVSLRRAEFESANLESMRASNGADLSEAQFVGARAPNAQFFGSRLVAAQLAHVDLSAADLSAADLSQACLNGCNLSSARLVAANLANARLVRANLFEANLQDASFARADLRGASCFSANFFRADLAGAQLELADLGRTLLDNP
jgi:uncharacterized protein YjbI with pentapeptide repeats